MFSRVNYAIENIMYIFYCDTKGQIDIKQNNSSDVRDDAQYKTNSHFVPQNYLANVRVTCGTGYDCNNCRIESICRICTMILYVYI